MKTIRLSREEAISWLERTEGKVKILSMTYPDNDVIEIRYIDLLNI